MSVNNPVSWISASEIANFLKPEMYTMSRDRQGMHLVLVDGYIPLFNDKEMINYAAAAVKRMEPGADVYGRTLSLKEILSFPDEEAYHLNFMINGERTMCASLENMKKACDAVMSQGMKTFEIQPDTILYGVFLAGAYISYDKDLHLFTDIEKANDYMMQHTKEFNDTCADLITKAMNGDDDILYEHLSSYIEETEEDGQHALEVTISVMGIQNNTEKPLKEWIDRMYKVNGDLQIFIDEVPVKVV